MAKRQHPEDDPGFEERMAPAGPFLLLVDESTGARGRLMGEFPTESAAREQGARLVEHKGSPVLRFSVKAK